MTVKRAEALNSVIGYAIASTHNAHTLRRGISRHSEHYAYELILPRVDKSHSNLETIAMRLSAVIAESQVPHNPELNFGAWLSRYSKGSEEVVKARLKQMVNLNAEDAIISVSRLLKIVKSKEGFNWYNLGKTLIFWGDGLSDDSMTVRRSIMRDYFISKDLQAIGEDNSELDESTSSTKEDTVDNQSLNSNIQTESESEVD